MAEVEMAEKSPEQREQSILNLICWIGAGLFLALIAYNLFASGSVISTDGLFFTVVPLVLALSFLAVPGMDMWKKRKAAKAAQAEGVLRDRRRTEPIRRVHQREPGRVPERERVPDGLDDRDQGVPAPQQTGHEVPEPGGLSGGHGPDRQGP